LLQIPLSTDTYRLTSGFGERIDPETKVRTLHNGIDFAAPKGTTIFAANDGVVILADKIKGYGETIIIKHNSEFTTLYGHILPGSFLVKTGDTVKKGQKIAEVGSSEATGSHLHFSVFKQGTAVNPSDYFKRANK
jgi:murein DD-endopeptidase MepM/ murein hydrolase activator NlpD